jgi:hypothetical protein
MSTDEAVIELFEIPKCIFFCDVSRTLIGNVGHTNVATRDICGSVVIVTKPVPRTVC